MTWWFRWGSSVRCGPGSQPGRVRDSDPCSDRYICLSPDSPSHWHGHGPSRSVLFASESYLLRRVALSESRRLRRPSRAVRVTPSESPRRRSDNSQRPSRAPSSAPRHHWQLEHPVGPGPPAAYVGGSSNVFRRLINFGPGRNCNFKAEFNGSVRKDSMLVDACE